MTRAHLPTQALARQPKKPRTLAAVTLSESQIQKAILDVLAHMPGVFAERQNTGASKASYTNKAGVTKGRFTQFSRPGAPDIRVCVAGRYIALEVKGPGGKQNENQVAWQRDFERAGGKYAVVTSVSEAVAAVRVTVKTCDICTRPLAECLCRETGADQ